MEKTTRDQVKEGAAKYGTKANAMDPDDAAVIKASTDAFRAIKEAARLCQVGRDLAKKVHDPASVNEWQRAFDLLKEAMDIFR